MPDAKPKTLEELLNSPEVGLPEMTYELCLSAKMNAEIDRLNTEIIEAVELEEAEKKADTPKRVGAKSPVMKLNDEREKLRAKMAEFTVTIRLRAKTAHDWRAWVAAHPPKKKSKDDESPTLDERLGYSADALQDAIPEFVADVNGEPLANGQWDKLAAVAAPGDLYQLAGIVRALHENGVRIPKSSTGFLKSRLSAGDSN